MAAAIEANWNAAFSLVGRSPIAQSDDDDPELRWYTTPKIPFSIFNHAYFTRPSPEGIDARIEELRRRFAAHRVPLMCRWVPSAARPISAL
jgi:hypothetical protein